MMREGTILRVLTTHESNGEVFVVPCTIMGVYIKMTIVRIILIPIRISSQKKRKR